MLASKSWGREESEKENEKDRRREERQRARRDSQTQRDTDRQTQRDTDRQREIDKDEEKLRETRHLFFHIDKLHVANVLASIPRLFLGVWRNNLQPLED